MIFPATIYRVISTDLEPRSVGDVVYLDAGERQYETRDGYRDLAVALSRPVLTRTRELERELSVDHVEVRMRDVVDHHDAAFDRDGAVNLVMLYQAGELLAARLTWQGVEGVTPTSILGKLFVGARYRGYEDEDERVTVDRPEKVYVVRWRYDRMEDLS